MSYYRRLFLTPMAWECFVLNTYKPLIGTKDVCLISDTLNGYCIVIKPSMKKVILTALLFFSFSTIVGAQKKMVYFYVQEIANASLLYYYNYTQGTR